MPTLEATAHALDSCAFHSARKLPYRPNIKEHSACGEPRILVPEKVVH